MREISDITKDLQSVSLDLKEKTKKRDDTHAVYEKASKEMSNAQVKMGQLQAELNEAITLLVPGSLQSGVRVSN